MSRTKIQAATELALEMLAPVELISSASAPVPRQVWLHPYVVGFFSAFCNAAAQTTFDNRNTQEDTSRVIQAVYEKLFGISERELLQPLHVDKSEAKHGWHNATLILATLSGKATKENEERISQALLSVPKETVDRQGAGPSAVGVFWNEHFVKKVTKLAAGPQE